MSKPTGLRAWPLPALTAEAESSSYEKFLTEEEKTAIRTALGAETGDVLLLVADGKNKVVFGQPGRPCAAILAAKLDLIQPGTFDFLWVTDFPMYEWSEEENRFMAMHHPFTSPKLEDLDKMASGDLGHVYARAYDMVLNGTELGGGSIRINDPDHSEQGVLRLGLHRGGGAGAVRLSCSMPSNTVCPPTAVWPTVWIAW